MGGNIFARFRRSRIAADKNFSGQKLSRVVNIAATVYVNKFRNFLSNTRLIK